ncbi:hypothetical protein Tco_0845033 [Tanacetum coccineum]
MAEAEQAGLGMLTIAMVQDQRPAKLLATSSYSEFLKCKPLDFKGTRGMISNMVEMPCIRTTTTEAAHASMAATKKMMIDNSPEVRSRRLRLRCGILKSKALMWWPIVDDFSNKL